MPTLKNFVPDEIKYNSTLPLFDYHQKSKLKQASNLFSDYDLPKEALDPKIVVDEVYYPHLKQEINLHQIVDFTQYRTTNEIAPHLSRYFKIDFNFGLYEPIQYISDFWCLMRDMILLDDPKMTRITQIQKEGVPAPDENDKRD